MAIASMSKLYLVFQALNEHCILVKSVSYKIFFIFSYLLDIPGLKYVRMLMKFAYRSCRNY